MMRRLTILDYISLDGIIQAPGAALAAGWRRDHRNVQCVDENRGAPSDRTASAAGRRRRKERDIRNRHELNRTQERLT
jgi:hypothetical protein